MTPLKVFRTTSGTASVLIPHDAAANIPQSLLVITLVSNFGTFLLYMMTCIIAIVAFQEHHSVSWIQTCGRSGVRPPGESGSACSSILIGPFSVAGMSWKEPYIALGSLQFGAVYGVIPSLRRARRKPSRYWLSLQRKSEQSKDSRLGSRFVERLPNASVRPDSARTLGRLDSGSCGQASLRCGGLLLPARIAVTP